MSREHSEVHALTPPALDFTEAGMDLDPQLVGERGRQQALAWLVDEVQSMHTTIESSELLVRLKKYLEAA